MRVRLLGLAELIMSLTNYTNSVTLIFLELFSLELTKHSLGFFFLGIFECHKTEYKGKKKFLVYFPSVFKFGGVIIIRKMILLLTDG